MDNLEFCIDPITNFLYCHLKWSHFTSILITGWRCHVSLSSPLGQGSAAWHVLLHEDAGGDRYLPCTWKWLWPEGWNLPLQVWFLNIIGATSHSSDTVALHLWYKKHRLTMFCTVPNMPVTSSLVLYSRKSRISFLFFCLRSLLYCSYVMTVTVL